jgi:hypothetical protein
VTEPRKILEVGEPCRGNTGQWGRIVVYEVQGPLGPMAVVDWEQLPEPETPDRGQLLPNPMKAWGALKTLQTFEP